MATHRIPPIQLAAVLANIMGYDFGFFRIDYSVLFQIYKSQYKKKNIYNHTMCLWGSLRHIDACTENVCVTLDII